MIWSLYMMPTPYLMPLTSQRREQRGKSQYSGMKWTFWGISTKLKRRWRMEPMSRRTSMSSSCMRGEKQGILSQCTSLTVWYRGQSVTMCLSRSSPSTWPMTMVLPWRARVSILQGNGWAHIFTSSTGNTRAMKGMYYWLILANSLTI